MQDIRRYYLDFEALVAQVLEELNYEVELASRRKRSDSIHEIDIVARLPDGAVLPVEVKFFSRVTLARLRDDSSLTARLKQFASKSRPLLVYSSDIEPSRRVWAQEEFQIEVWDRSILLGKAGLRTRAALEQLFAQYEESRAAKPAPATPDLGMISAPAPEPQPTPEPLPAPKGKHLKARLRAIDAGRKDAKDYEAVCKDIIEYLFGDDLRDVRSQKRTTDGVNIYDLIYRVRPKHRFWTTLTRDFRARVVLFECKNYGKPIGAAQVFTTERYLSASALRPICFVLTRKPAHRHAVQAASGAMRETGKLLVFLSDVDIEQMLDAKDAQLKEGGSAQEMEDNDPTEVLDQAVYDFIAGIPR